MKLKTMNEYNWTIAEGLFDELFTLFRSNSKEREKVSEITLHRNRFLRIPILLKSRFQRQSQPRHLPRFLSRRRRGSSDGRRSCRRRGLSLPFPLTRAGVGGLASAFSFRHRT